MLQRAVKPVRQRRIQNPGMLRADVVRHGVKENLHVLLVSGGHQVLLGAGNAYRFTATRTGVLMQQTVLGDLSVEKWSEICFT